MSYQPYFAIGATLAGMANLSTLLTFPVQVPPGGRVPFTGPVGTRGVDPLLVRDGYKSGKWIIPIADDDELWAFITALYGGVYVDSARLYVTTLDEQGKYSPYYAYVERPSVTDGTLPVVLYAGGARLKGVVVTLTDCILQFLTKSASYTRTASDRLIYWDTASGNRVDTLPAANAVTPNTAYSSVVSVAGHNVVETPVSGDTINQASTLTISGLNTRVEFYSDGVSNWNTI